MHSHLFVLSLIKFSLYFPKYSLLFLNFPVLIFHNENLKYNVFLFNTIGPMEYN